MTARSFGIALVAALLATTNQVLADDLTGQASVIDGDTIEIHGTRIRLWGIDAPESTQLCRAEDSLQYRCGAKAANDLGAFIARKPVSCTPISLDRYGRTVATCSVGGTDLGQWLVSNGLALGWPNFSRGMYDTAQREAEHAGRGMWSGSYVAPWLFRACEPVEGQPIAQMTRMPTPNGPRGDLAQVRRPLSEGSPLPPPVTAYAFTRGLIQRV